MRRSLDEFERWSGLRVPAAVREWYAMPAAPELLARRGNLVTTEARLGEPVGGIDYLAQGLLVTETDSQGCCRWAVRLHPLPSRYRAEPLFDLPGPTVADEDPAVWLVDPDDAEPVPRRYAGCFSDYVFTAVWDAGLWADAATRTEYDRRLPEDALATLRRHLDELPTTYSWAGNQPCDAVYRFDGSAQVLVAVTGGVAVLGAMRARGPRPPSAVLSALGW